jgi:hypothetical protein
VAVVDDVPEEWRIHEQWAPGWPTRPFAWMDPAGNWHRERPRRADAADMEAPRRVWRRWFRKAYVATWALYRTHGWDALVVGPLPGHAVSGCEQTELVAALQSRNHPAAVDGAIAGISHALGEIGDARAVSRLVPPPGGPPAISGGMRMK